LVQDGDEDHRQRGPHEKDPLQTIVSDYREIVFDVWIAPEELVSPPEDEDSAKQKEDYGESDYDTQGRNPSLLNDRHNEENVGVHVETIGRPK
jgi:hypothetical protein